MNNFFNFQTPYFNQQFGSDWDDFNDITEENVDYIMNKTWQLYWLRRIDTMPVMALEQALRLRAIEVEAADSIALKKYKLRKFNTSFKEKGTADFYLDYQEEIVGTRGVIYSGLYFGASIWGSSSWAISGGTPSGTELVWATTYSPFHIYIDVKTTDSALLDELVAVYSQTFLRPAFYQIYLVDSTFTILRSI